MIRIIDIILSSLGLLILSPLIVLVYLIIYKESKSPFFTQQRIGKKMNKFSLIKFRTMSLGTGDYATHLVDSSKISKVGNLLRRTKLDELPQLWNVLKGEMSIVGPRPCLINQKELIKARQKFKIYNTKPGITGLAQINGIDMSDPILLAKTEYKMIKSFNIFYYFYYIFLTLIGFGLGDRVKK